MDKEELQLYSKKENFLENVDQSDSIAKPDVSFVEVSDLSISEDMNIEEKTLLVKEKFVQDSIAQIQTDSVLLKSNDTEEHCKGNSINTPMKASNSLSNFSDEFPKYQICIDNSLPGDKCLQKSSSYNDIRLPTSTLSSTLSHTSSDVISDCSIESASNKYKELSTSYNDEEETVFSSKLYIESEGKLSEEKYKNSEITNSVERRIEDVIQNSNMDGKFITNNDQPKNVLKSEWNFNKDQQPYEAIKNVTSQNYVVSRPTLADDSRLVKISLPTNPINIMQSNAQFLNKSRTFLSFITEKSTNIMEKALLPQHLTMKYNSVMKSIDNAGSEKKCIDESSNTESSLIGVGNQLDSSNKDKHVPYTVKSLTDIQGEGNERAKNDENKNTFVMNSNKSLYANSENSNKFDSINSDVHKIHDSIHSVETNGNNDIDFMVLNSEESILDIQCKKEDSTDLDNSKQSLLQHPAYMGLLKDYADLKSKHLMLQDKVEHLEKRSQMLEIGNKGESETFAVQTEELEKTINRLTFELRASLEAQEVLKREYNAANKEKESMVMKYAVGEKQLIDTQRARDSAERKVKEMTTQQEMLQSKLREMQAERSRICNILSGKHREAADLQKEVEKLREDVKMRDIKLQWTQNKLKTEMDLQKETQQKLDKVTIRVTEMKEECEQVRKETQETMRKFQQSEENKAVTLDQQLKEQQARLILERHVTEDKEMLRLQLQKEVDTLKHRQQVLIEENNTLTLRIQDAEKNRLNYESNLSNLKIIADQRQKEIVELLSKVSELETLKIQLQYKDQYIASTETEIQNLRAANEELQADMSACRQKEAEMLDFTQKLTDKNVRLQTEFSIIEIKVKQLEQEHGPLHDRINKLLNEVKALEESLVQERNRRTEECEILAKRLAEQTQVAQNLAIQLEDSQGENAVLKRKQQLSAKEMTRELQQCRKKLEKFETEKSSPHISLSVTSRNGSNASLNTVDFVNGALSENNINGDRNNQIAELSAQKLIDRIVKLQESNVKQAEKLDFYEGHTKALMEELNRKKKIIQNYILRESTGAMGGYERDKNKADLARHGGIMASVYTQRVSDDNMTLELSLEMNQKLQAVLEDTLLKNMVLKDNIDTLSTEISQLLATKTGEK